MITRPRCDRSLASLPTASTRAAPPSLHIVPPVDCDVSFKVSGLGITSGPNLYTLGADANGPDAAPG